jgi:starvation-inducible DNA-binding protein
MSAALQHRFATHNDLPSTVRETLIPLLNQQLADTLDLYSQVKQAHWNVKGMQFIQLHLLFDTLADSVSEYVDQIAERVTTLGGTAMGTTRMAATASRLPEFPAEIVLGRDVIEVLAQRYGAYTSSSRDLIDTATEHEDAVTADLFTEITRTLDKQLWMIEAHLQA